MTSDNEPGLSKESLKKIIEKWSPYIYQATTSMADDPAFTLKLKDPAIHAHLCIMLQAMEDRPDFFRGGFSFRRAVQDYEEQAAIAKKEKEAFDTFFERIAQNPPHPETGITPQLHTFIYSQKPVLKNGDKYEIRIDIWIRCEPLEPGKTRVLFKANSAIDAYFQKCEQVPTHSELKLLFQTAILDELKELHVKTFRFQIFEPILLKQSSTGTRIGFRK